MSIILALKNIHYSVGQKTVLNHLNFNLHSNEIYSLIGLSGAGKSTLLKIILGLHQPQSGDYYLNNQLISPTSTLPAIINTINIVFQNNALFDSLSVYENIGFNLLYSQGLSRFSVTKRVLSILDKVQLPKSVMNQSIYELSGGMQKRVAIARTLIQNPSILLLDEPTTGLDPQTNHTILELIRSIQAQDQLSIVLITHDMETVINYSHRVGLLHNQHIEWEGLPSLLRGNSHPILQRFF